MSHTSDQKLNTKINFETYRYIDAATNTKNVVILLDMSGSMFGQRYEIAKQTIESILETLSENDFFNIIMVNFKFLQLNNIKNTFTVQGWTRVPHTLLW